MVKSNEMRKRKVKSNEMKNEKIQQTEGALAYIFIYMKIKTTYNYIIYLDKSTIQC